MQNLKDGTVHDKPLDIYLYLNKMGLVEQGVETITFVLFLYFFQHLVVLLPYLILLLVLAKTIQFAIFTFESV